MKLFSGLVLREFEGLFPSIGTMGACFQPLFSKI